MSPHSDTGARGTNLPPPPFSNFLFTNLFSIKCLYFFIISSLFRYFNLSIFIQSYVNIKLHVSTLYSFWFVMINESMLAFTDHTILINAVK